MGVRDHLDWPWFDDAHRALAASLRDWAGTHLQSADEPADVDAACRKLVKALGDGGWLRYCVPKPDGGALDAIDARSLCVVREILAYHDALADFSFALQGLGSAPIAMGGSDALRSAYLPRVAQGSAIAAFAISEPDAGSDVGALRMSARRDGDFYILDGEKTWISNGGIAAFYVVFARIGETRGSDGVTAFVVDASTPGLDASARIDVMAPHPLATVRLRHCRVPRSQRVGQEGEGFKLAMQTLDLFRPSVAAAAIGFARRALDEAVRHASQRRMFDQTLADFQLTQAAIGDMVTTIDAGALLAYRAAWLRDTSPARVTKEAASAKLFATEAAQRVIDRSLQMFGGQGVVRGNMLERLYRDVRALRIYEGASEVQQLIVGRQTLAEQAEVRP